MKRIFVTLSLVFCSPMLEGMADVKMRKAQLGEQRITKAACRLQIKKTYENLQHEIQLFEALQPAEKASRNEAHLQSVQEHITVLEKLESIDSGFSHNRSRKHKNSLTLFKSALKKGEVRAELFKKLLQTSIAAEVCSLQAESKRAAAVLQEREQREHKIDVAAQEEAGAGADRTVAASLPEEQRTQDDRGDKKSAAAAAAEKPKDEKEDAKTQSELDDSKSKKSGKMRATAELGGLCITGAAVKALIWQGGKFALKGSNPVIAGGLTALELYRLGAWLLED